MSAPPHSVTIPSQRSLLGRLRLYFPLIKGLQTLLLLITGLGGYMSTHSPDLRWQTLLGLSASLFLAIGGSTILNMVYDRDIDARMKRTNSRPLAAGRVNPHEALSVGLILSWLGVGWGILLDPLYGLVVFAGLFIDVVVYTIWLKRRTPWSILWGGISGGMPILAGRALGLGHIDLVGILLALGVLTWIPSHIMPLTIKYREDYHHAGVPTFPGAYGVRATHTIVSASVGITAVVMLAGAALSGISQGFLLPLGLLGAALLAVAVINTVVSSSKLNFGLFKFASLYMLGAMVLMVIG